MHSYLAKKPFDLYSIHLFHLVVRHSSFTRAAREAGISQSALTRQIQGLEQRLGLDLINRTTRSVEITEAGRYLAAEAARLVGGVASTLTGIQTLFGSATPEVRVGVSRSMAMAHMPGLFHAHQQRNPDLVCKIHYSTSASILTALETAETDIGVLCPPTHLPETVKVTHKFKDAFDLIGPTELLRTAPSPKRPDRVRAWLANQRWLMLPMETHTGQTMTRWLKRQGISVKPAMELDSFDLIINLVLSGFGVGLVPHRALALYRRKGSWETLNYPERFERQIVVATRKARKLPPHVQTFVDNILF